MPVHYISIHPLAKDEFRDFSGQLRGIGEDMGRHFERLRAYGAGGLPDHERPWERDAGVDLHKIYGRKVLMVLAKRDRRIGVLHFSVLAGEHEESLAGETALERKREWFDE